MSEIKKLGDIASYINGYPFKPEDRGTEGLPIIRIQDLTGNAYDLGFYNGEYPERIEINDGDVLISWSASLGVYIWNRGKALLNQDVFSEEKGRVEGCLRHIEKEENATPVALVGGHGSGEIYEKQIELHGIKTVKLEICSGYDSFMSTVRADTGFIHGRKGIMASGACI